MPYSSPHECNDALCHRLTTKRFCDVHQKKYDEKRKAYFKKRLKDDPIFKQSSLESKRRYNQARGSSKDQGYGHKWQKLRKMKLSRDPLCEECFKKGGLRPAMVVHHIVHKKEGGSNEFKNLQSLCRRCHEKIHGRIHASFE